MLGTGPSMEGFALVLIASAVIVVSAAVVHHAAHAEQLWPFARVARRPSAAPAPADAMAAADLGDYVRRGLEDLSVMLAQAARRRPG